MIIYYLAGKKPNEIKHPLIESLGLGYAFDAGASLSIGSVRDGGPDGGAGVIIGRDGAVVEYVPTIQRWEQSVANEAVWIGYPNKINPLDMIRDRWRGSPLVIESGNYASIDGVTWPVPRAAAWSTNAVPKELKWNGETFVVGKTVAMFERIEQIAQSAIEDYVNSMLPDNFFELCAEIIGIVYHVGPQEFGSMRIVTNNVSEAQRLLEIVMDVDGLNDRIKKNERDAPSDLKHGDAA